ncbi:biotinidase-like [Artemia franciscana]
MSRRKFADIMVVIHVILMFLPSNMGYKAAVVEYAPVGIYGPNTAVEIIRLNLDQYEEIVNLISDQGMDVIVFPEYGITTLQVPSNRTRAKEFLQRIPNIDLNHVPCDSLPQETIDEVVYRLSCLAKRAASYLVANFGEIQSCTAQERGCPYDGSFHYNVNVVFNRDGKLIAKYRKTNLFGELAMDKPNEADYTVFTTDFGVSFGVAICFDMIYRTPLIELYEKFNITNFIISTAWVDELPFLTAPQIQSGLAQGLNATFLVSGYHQPSGGQLGSGIFQGMKDHQYTFSITSKTRIIIDEISEVILSRDKTSTKNMSFLQGEHYILSENLLYYNHTDIDQTSNITNICHNSTCCSVIYTLNPTKKTHYKLVAYNGVRYVGGGQYAIYIETCGVLACKDELISSCGQRDADTTTFESLELRGNFQLKYPLPSVIDGNLQLFEPNSYGFSNFDSFFTLKSNHALDELLTFSLYGFSYDLY